MISLSVLSIGWSYLQQSLCDFQISLNYEILLQGPFTTPNGPL